MKKIDFFLMFKIDFRDRKWPENGLKGVLKWFKTQNWQLNQFSANFEKKEKIDFFFKIYFFYDLRPNIDFPAEFRPEIGRKPFHTIIPPSKKKWFALGRSTLDFPLKNVFGLHFGQNKVYYLRSLKSLN